MPVGWGSMWPGAARTPAPPKVGRPHRDRAKNKAQRNARKRTRRC